MRYIKDNDYDKYSEMIKIMIKDFDSYQYVLDKIDIILKEIDDDIDYVDFNIDDDNIIKNIEITLNDYIVYGVNYDKKNYPLISFCCNKIVFNNIDTILVFDDDLIIDLSKLDIENFVRIE